MVDKSNEDELELPENLKKSLEDIIKTSGVINYKLKVSPGSKKGDNYLGIVYKVKVTGSKENGDDVILNFFCKVPINGESLRIDFGLRNYFLREIKFYDEIIKDMKQIEYEKGIKNGFTSYSKCLVTNSTNLEEFLILEDLSTKGYIMFDRLKKLDFAHTQLVMKALGKFHAHSFAMREQKPEMFKKYAKEIPDLLYNAEMTPSFPSYVDGILKSCLEKMKFDGIYKEKWENMCTNYLQGLKDCVDGNLAEPYAVIGHGDCWNNNMMFKYENDKPTEVCMVDFQVCRYVSPVIDLLYYIFGCTEKPLRDLHYEKLLKIYYESLSQFLKELGSDPEKLFPYSAFQAQLKKFGKFAAAIGVYVLPVIVSPETKSIDELFEDSAEITNNKKTEAIWTSRLSDVVIDCVNLGYL